MLQETPGRILQDTKAVVLETERLVLRQPTLNDVKAIAGLVSDKRVAINLRRVPHPYTLADATDFVTATAHDDLDTVFLVEHGCAAVGIVGLHWGDDAPELGYCYGVDHWGNGYATEAARAAIDFAFQQFTIDRIDASARVVNTASRHVIEKCGFNWIGVQLHRFLALGSSTPVDCFKLDRSVWSSLRTWRDATQRSG